MAYNVNKSDGTTIVVLDGTKDTTSTSITLVGRLVQNYGVIVSQRVSNEFVKAHSNEIGKAKFY